MLSRSKTVDDAVMRHMVEKAKNLGFKLDGIIYVDQKDSTLPPAASPGAPAAPAPAQ
jgi:hypothetical protein